MDKKRTIQRQSMSYEQARFYAKSLDECEADLVHIQRRLFRVREALQKHIGEVVGYQYDEEENPSELRPRLG